VEWRVMLSNFAIDDLWPPTPEVEIVLLRI
jgi:hypothetical protein